MNGAGDELLAGAGLATNQHGGAGGGDRLGQLQNLTQRCAFPDDLAEVVLGADLLLEVRLFLVQLVPECLDFLEGQGVRDGDRDLIGNEVQELQLGFLVGIRLLAREGERADPAPSGGQRKIAAALHSIRGRSFRETRPTRLPTHVRDDQRALRLPGPARWEVLDRNSRRGRGYGFEGLQNVQAHRVTSSDARLLAPVPARWPQGAGT